MKKKLSNKLSLKKETLIALNKKDMSVLKGGSIVTNYCGTYWDCATDPCGGSLARCQ